MKNSFLCIALLSLSLMFFSCSNTTDKVISKESIGNDYKDLIEEGILSGRQDTVLSMLVSLSKGRDTYIKENGLDEDAAKILVNDEEFGKVANELFEDLSKSKVRYGDLMSEIDSLRLKQKEGQRKIDSLYILIDKRCIGVQQQIDSLSKVLNEFVEFELQSIKSSTYQYRDYINVSILATNKSDKTVEAVSFNFTIYDKLDEVITTLICTSSSRFNDSSTLNYSYEEYDFDRREIYKALEQSSMKRIGRTEQDIRKINLDGEIFGKDQINLKYKSSNPLFGFCPYLDKDDDLMKMVAAQELLNENVIDNFKSLKRITEISKSLISLDNFKKSLRDALRGD